LYHDQLLNSGIIQRSLPITETTFTIGEFVGCIALNCPCILAVLSDGHQL